MSDPADDFLEAASVPRHSSHGSGDLTRAEAIRQLHPEVTSVFVAAALGDSRAVERFLTAKPSLAGTKGGPYHWDALTYLCFSRYLRLAPERSAGFVQAAHALLQAGANPNTGFYEDEHQPHPCFESVLYGAAGVARHPDLTRLLLAFGADPNDAEVPYHAPETHDNRTLTILVESGRLSADSLATMLLRKADWHDREGMRLLLAHGASPKRVTGWGLDALQQAIRRDNALANVELLLDYGADPTVDHPHPKPNQPSFPSATVLAARRGRGDLLALFRARNLQQRLSPVDELFAACASAEADLIESIIKRDPSSLQTLKANAGAALAEFAGNGNTAGVRSLLDLGLDVDSRYGGDGYFAIPSESTALHVAAWKLQTETAQLLLERGANVDALDGKGRTPLQLAILGSVDSHWVNRRDARIIAALLAAGASASEITVPTGFEEADRLLASHVGST